MPKNKAEKLFKKMLQIPLTILKIRDIVKLQCERHIGALVSTGLIDEKVFGLLKERLKTNKKKLLTNGRRYDRVSELPLRPGSDRRSQQRRTLKTEQYVKP